MAINLMAPKGDDETMELAEQVLRQIKAAQAKNKTTPDEADDGTQSRSVECKQPSSFDEE